MEVNLFWKITAISKKDSEYEPVVVARFGTEDMVMASIGPLQDLMPSETLVVELDDPEGFKKFMDLNLPDV